MKIAYKKAQYSAEKGLSVEEKPKKILNRGAISIETGKPVESYIDNNDEAINRYYNDHSQVYVPGQGFISRTAANEFYTEQRKREEAEGLSRRNSAHSSNDYQSNARSSYGDRRTRAQTPEYQQAENTAKDYYYQKIAEFENARRIALDVSSKPGGMRDAALRTMQQVGEELKEAESNYRRYSNPSQVQKYLDNTPMNQLAAQQRSDAAAAKPFYVDGMGLVTAEEAKNALQENREVHYLGSGAWGADAGSAELVSVLDRLNEQNKQNKESAHRQQMQDAYAQTGREFRGQTSRLDMTGGLEEDLEKAKTAQYNLSSDNRALQYEKEALENDRSAEYLSKSAVEIANELKYTAGSGSGREIAANVAANSSNSGYASLNDTERRTILSLAAQGRWNDVEDYYNAIDARVNARVHKRRTENIQNASKAAQVGAGLSATLSAPAAFAQQLGAEVRNALSDNYRPIDINEGPTSYLRLAQTGQQESLKDLPDWAQFLGNAGYSIAQNAAVLPLGPAGAAIWLGASAAGQSSTEALENGSTLGQALLRGSASGLIESATEKLGLDNLFKVAKNAGKTGLKSFVGSVLKQAGTEGAEEAISEFANTLFDIVQMGEDSAYEQRYRELVASGMAESQAKAATNAEFFIKNPALAAAAGAVSGLLMGGGSAGIQQYHSGKTNRELASNSTALINAAMNLTKEDGTIKRESNAFQIADQISRDQRYGKKIDNNRYYELAQALEAEGVTVDDAVAAETARQQEAEAARAAEAEEQAKQRAEFEARDTAVQEKASALYREIASENGIENVADSPAVTRALSEYYQAVERSGGDFNSDAALEAARRAGNVVLNAYETAVASSEGIDAQVSDDGFGEARAVIGNSPVKISRSLENANPELYERALRTLNVTDDGASVGMVYDGLHEQFSDAFNAETEAAQLAELVDIMQSDDSVVDPDSLPEGSDIVDRAEDMARELFSRVRSGALAPVAAQENVSASSGVTLSENKIAPTASYRASAYEVGQKYTPMEMMQKFTQSAQGKDLNARTVLDVSNVVMKLGVKAEVQDLGDDLKNGFYDHRTGSIVINARAMRGKDSNVSTKGALTVFSHELVHHLRVTGAYKDLVNVVKRGETMKALLELLSEKSGKKVYFKDIVANKRLEYAEYGVELTYAQAEEEVVAEFVAEHYLGSTERINELVNMDRSLAQKILDWFRDILARLNLMDPGYTEIQKAHAAIKIALEQRVEMGDVGDGVSFNLNTWEQSGRDTLDQQLAGYVSDGTITAKDANDIMTDMDAIYETATKLRGESVSFSQWSDATVELDEDGYPIFSVVVKNGEYPLNIDFSLVCKKRRALDAVLNEIARSGIMTAEELSPKVITQITEKLKSEGFEVACALCFVDSKRYRIGSWAKSFADAWNPLAELARSGNVGELTRISKEQSVKPSVRRLAEKLAEDPAIGRSIEATELISSEGMDALKKNDPAIYQLVMSHQGSARPKPSHGDVPYFSDILKRSDFTAENAYAVGGVRVQSFSDYVPYMFFDYAQMVADMAAKKLPAHAYTKETDFARLFGLTGMKINMSLVPAVDPALGGENAGLDANGNYLWADETFNYNDGIEIKKDARYRKNVGFVAVGVSDRHIEKLLADPNIDMVIPYHKSSINPAVAKARNINQYKNYEKQQRTKYKESGKSIPGNREFDFYADLAKTKDPKQTASNYLKWCEENNYTPKFPGFANNPNYYKMLIDFSVYDGDTYTPQQAVKTVFPENTADIVRKGLEKYDPVASRITTEAKRIAAEIAGQKSYSIGSGTMEDRLLSYIEKYGTLTPGERVQHMDGSGRESGTWQAPARTSDNTYTRKSVQTFANAPALSPADRKIAMEMADTVGQYVRVGNRETVQQAREKREQYSTFDQAVGAFLSEAKDARIKDARVLVAMGQQLLMESANEQHNKQATWDIMASLEELLTQLGQGVQAASIINRLSPEGRLVRVRRIVNEAIKRQTDYLKKAERKENGKAADAAAEAAEANEAAAKDIRKLADDIRRGAGDEEISRQVEAIKKGLEKKIGSAVHDSEDSDNGTTPPSRDVERLEKKKRGLESRIGEVLGSETAQKELLDLINGTTREISKLSAADKRYTASIAKKQSLLDERIEEWMIQQQITDNTKAELDRIRSELKEVNRELRKARYDEQRYAAEGIRKIEVIAKRREELLLELAKRDAAREDILKIRAELNEANAELRRAKRQASAAINQYKKVVDALNGVQADKSSGRYKKAVEAFDLAKQSAKDAKAFAKYAQDNFIQPPTELMERLAKAETVEEQKKIEDQIVLFLAEQSRGTAVEKANSWRYLSMLGNLKTHERNFFSTAASFGASRFKDMVAVGAEKVLIRDKNKKTKAMVTAADRDLLAEADRIFRERADDISGNRRESLASRIQDNRKIWGNNDESKPLGRALNAIERPVGKLSDWNSSAMEWEDRLFMKFSFRTSYAGLLKARGWTPSTMTEQQKAEAFEYAKKQAQDVTFHTPSAFADWVSRGRNKLGAGAFFLDAVVPFTKTPANVLKAGIEYSPLGLFKTGIKALRKAYDGDIAGFAEDLSKNFTGLALAGLGMVFAHAGIIVASGDDDDPDRKNAMDKVGGFQSYSLVLGDISFSLDWLTYVIMPMMVGVELYNAIWGESEGDRSAGILTRALDVLTTSVNPLFETSMLDGIASAFQSYSSGGKFAWDVIHSILESYASQFIPTTFGQLARTIDPIKRSTYSSKDSAWTKSLEQTARRLASKVPGMSFLLEPVIDRAGQETPQISANALVRAFAQFISPGNVTFDETTGVDDELLRLYDALGETDVLPKTMKSSVTYNGETYSFSPAEYTAYAARRGTITYSELESLMASPEYAEMSDEERHDAVAEIIDRGDKEAKAAFLDERGIFNYVKQSTNLEKAQHILEQDWTVERKFEEFTAVMSEKRNEQIKSLLSDGWTQDDIMQGFVKYAELDKSEGLKASAARAELANFMAERAQKNLMKASEVTNFLDVFNVGTYMPAQAGSYEKLYAAGLSSSAAKKVSDKLLALKPLDGSEDVSTAQRLQAIVSSGISAGEQWEVMEAYYATSEPRLNDIAAYKAAGASAAAYAKMYEAKTKIDKEAEAHKDDDSYEGKTYHYYKLIAETAANEAEAEAAYKSFIGDTEGEREKLKPLEEAGIPYSKIVEYRYKTALLTADKDANGKSISGSKKDKVLREINALSVSAAQKDALYIFSGYSTKDLNKAPWH